MWKGEGTSMDAPSMLAPGLLLLVAQSVPVFSSIPSLAAPWWLFSWNSETSTCCTEIMDGL